MSDGLRGRERNTRPVGVCGGFGWPKMGAALVVAAVLGCGTPPSTHPDLRAADYPGRLVAPDVRPQDFMWRQRVTATWGRAHRSFDAVLQKRAGVLQMVGLSPMGQPGFVASYDGERVSLTNRTGQPLPFPPRFILLDVQRVWYPQFPAPAASDGARRARIAGEDVVERWEDGHLVARGFFRAAQPERGWIRITYDGWRSGDAVPRHARLESGWFGYRLDIETLEQTRL